MASPFWKSEIVTSDVPTGTCWKCHKSMDRATGDCTPNPGDLSLCMYCGNINAFADDLTLREPTQAELQVFESHPGMVNVRRRLVQEIALQRFRPSPPRTPED